MSLQERLEGYRVTTVPGPGRLRLSWFVAEAADGANRATASAEESGRLAVLASYRITRVPVRAGR